MRTEKVWFKNSKGQKLAGIFYIPDGEGPFPAVVVCHGFSTSKESRNVIMCSTRLIKHNIITFGIDFNGHGESEGKFEDVTVTQAIDDIKCAIDFVEKQNFVDKDKIGLMGASFGGITSIFQASRENRIKVLALRAPMIVYEHRFGIGDIDVEEWKKKGYYLYYQDFRKEYLRLNYSYYLDGIKYNAIEVADKINVPTIIVAAGKDTLIPREDTQEFFDKLKVEKRIEFIEGVDHWFVEDINKKAPEETHNKVFDMLCDWIIKYLT